MKADVEAALDLDRVRAAFPALQRTCGGAPCIFADAPGGTQVPSTVIDAISRYLGERDANSGGPFVTSEETDETIAAARRAAADLIGCDAGEVVFGPNMTSLAFALSRALARDLRAGDEVVVTTLDHDANIAPWVAAATDAGATVRWVDVRTDDCTLDLDGLDAVLSPRTRIVAYTLASNAVGTVTAAHEIVQRARTTDAIVIADAVHLAPHRSIDARSLGADVLFCSPYKFFGPHLGVMSARKELLDGWRPYKVRPSLDESPDRWETGTKNHEALAGLVATVDYIAGLSEPGAARAGRQAALASGMEAVRRAEATLSQRFLDGIGALSDVRLYGIADAARLDERTPTFALRLGDLHPRVLAEQLGARGIFTWDGNYYALAIMQRLGLEDSGGAVRIGFCHYNSIAEVDRVIGELERLSQRPAAPPPTRS
ncbi:MAG: cysteine desulfurase-like protein [Actinomycetota bacterium]